MFKKILIANRGEIAVRIIRAAKELGIKTVAVYSEADKESLHVTLADEAVCIGGISSSESYLKIPNIIAAAEITGADAIHPGYGFLSENARFGKICEMHNLTFIGPRPECIIKMGDKATARATAIENGVPITNGTGIIKSIAEAKKEVNERITYPVMIKATAGGGGKGMRIARNDEELAANIVAAQNEAESAFGNPDVYIEKFVEDPRHIEIQIMGDKHGNVIYLGERDCSIQRRHQKLIEEAPSFSLPYNIRKAMGEAAVTLAKAINYDSAGTLEFLVDKNNDFFFMEMNTRIQVEHPVTETVTGIDLIKEQIKIADGQPLSYKQKDIKINGHAIECRINAENPLLNFRPSPGVITDLYLPGGNGVRIDSAVYNGYEVTPYYDSMLAKLIVHGENREEAIKKMISALGEVIVEGIDTNVDYLYGILNDSVFQSGHFDVNFIENFNKNIENIA